METQKVKPKSLKSKSESKGEIRQAGSYTRELSADQVETQPTLNSDAQSRKSQNSSGESSRIDEIDRVLDGSQKPESELSWEHGLRPQQFEDFPGQDKVKEKLKVFVGAAKARGEPLDHILLSGPPGLGKTTLSHIIANTMNVDFKSTSGPALDKKATWRQS